MIFQNSDKSLPVHKVSHDMVIIFVVATVRTSHLTNSMCCGCVLNDCNMNQDAVGTHKYYANIFQ